MSRDAGLLIEDMIQPCEKIQRYVAGRPRLEFEADEQALDAVLKNLEVLGEAAKHLPDTFKNTQSEVSWRDIAGLRDIIVHEYFGIDLDIIWDVVDNRVPALLPALRSMK